MLTVTATSKPGWFKDAYVTLRSSRLLLRLGLLVILLLALWVRARDITTLPMWYDEVIEYKAAQKPVKVIVEGIYYPVSKVLAHFALQLEDSVRGLRLPSLLAGICSVWLMYVLLSTAGMPLAGLVAALLLALSWFHVQNSIDARYYSLLVAFWLASLVSLIYCVRGHRLYYVWYVLATVLGVFSHPVFIVYAGFAVAAAVAFLLFDRSRPLRHRLQHAAVLSAAFGAVFVILITRYLMQIANRPQQRVTTGGSEGHVLTFEVYWSIIKEVFFSGSMPADWVWAALAVAGLVLLFVRAKLLGSVTVVCLFVLPLPLMLIEFRLPYRPRYLSNTLPMLILPVAVIISEGFQRAAKLLAHDAPRQGGRTRQLFWKGGGAVLLLATAACLWMLTNSQYAKLEQMHAGRVVGMVRHDWPGISRQLAHFVQPGDPVVHHIDFRDKQYWFYHSKSILDHYMHWAVTRGQLSAFNNTQINTTDPHQLLEVGWRNPFSNIWVLEWDYYSLLPRQIRDLIPSKHPFRRLTPRHMRLRVWGEPTSNMVPGGGFDRREPDRYLSNRANVQITGRELAEEGNGAILLSGTSSETFFEIPVVHPGISIRNPRMDRWEGAKPAGWSLAEGTTASLRRIPGKDKGSSAVEISTGSVVLQQEVTGLEPRSRFRLSASVRSESSSTPTISFIYYNAQGRQAVDLPPPPKRGSWENVFRDFTIPEDADPHPFLLEITSAGGHSSIDEVHMRTLVAPRLFDPGKIYTLTAAMKSITAAAPSDDQDIPSVTRVYLVGTTADTGASFQQLLLEITPASDSFRTYSVRIDPARFPELSEVKAGRLRFERAEGNLPVLVDSIQLEPKPYPTPFVDGIREPHDDVLARLGFHRD